MQKNVYLTESSSECDIFNAISLIDDLFKKDPNFIENIPQTLNMSTSSNEDEMDWYKLWKTVSLKHESHDQRTVLQQKQEERREKNRKSAKVSRDRKKQAQVRDKENYECLTKENKQLIDDIKKLKIQERHLEYVMGAFIHEGSCMNNTHVINDNISGCNVSEETFQARSNEDLDIALSEMATTSKAQGPQYEEQSFEQDVDVQVESAIALEHHFAPPGVPNLNYIGYGLHALPNTFQSGYPINSNHVSATVCSSALSSKPAISIASTYDGPCFKLLPSTSQTISHTLKNRNSVQTCENSNTPNNQYPLTSRTLDSLPVALDSRQVYQTAVFSSQNGAAYLPLHPSSQRHFTFEHPWSVGTSQQIDKESQELEEVRELKESFFKNM